MFFGAKKDKGKSGKGKVFGVVLDGASKEIPQILEACVVFLDATGLELEGVFRKSGSLVTMNQYKAKFDNGEPVDFSDVMDPHIVAGLLKMFIREYPEPLLTFELYDCFLAAVAIPDVNTKVPKVKQVLAMLPEANLRIVRYLVSFLCRVTSKSEVNLMTPQNLAIVFAPNLMRPPYEGDEGIGIMMEDTPYANQLLQLLINYYDDLFLDTVKPAAAAQKAQPTPPVKPVATPNCPPISSPIITSSRSSSTLPSPPVSEQASDEPELFSTLPLPSLPPPQEDPESYPDDINPFSFPDPPPKPLSRFANGHPPDKPSSSPQPLPPIPETRVLSAPAPLRSQPKAGLEIFSPPNPPPKPTRSSVPPPAPSAVDSNPFEEDLAPTRSPELPTSPPLPKPSRSPRLTARSDSPDTPINTNPFAQPTAPPKPPRHLTSSRSASSIPVDTNPFSPTAPSKRASTNRSEASPTPQPPIKPPRLSTSLQANNLPVDTNPFSPPIAPPRPPRDFRNSTGLEPPPKPPRAPSMNLVPTGSASPPVELNPFATPTPPPKPTRPTHSLHKHNKSLPNSALLVLPTAKTPPDSNSVNRRTMPAIYPSLPEPTSTTTAAPSPPPQLYPVLAQSK